MSIQGIGPTFEMRPDYESHFFRPYYRMPDQPLPPVGQLLKLDNRPFQAPFTGNRDGSANLLNRMGADVAAQYGTAQAARHAPANHGVNLLV